MIKLIIAEKPPQAKKYAEALGNPIRKGNVWIIKNSQYIDGEIRIVAASGHLFKIKNPYEKNKANWKLENLPCIPTDFKYELSTIPKNNNYNSRIKSLFETIKKEVSTCDHIIIATDADREGEYIAYSILEKIPNGVKKITERLWIGSLTDKSIQEGFQNLKKASETKNFYFEAKARSIADWLVGFNYSPLVTLSSNIKGMNVGRVQTPTVSLVCANDTAIKNFVPTPFWLIQAKDSEGNIFTNKALKFSDIDSANEILDYMKSKKQIINSVENEIKENSSPKLFSLTSLQGYASKLLKISPKEVLEVVSSLYQKTYLTYPRTDISYLTESEYSYLYENFDNYNQILSSNVPMTFKQSRKKYVDDAKVKQHIAIIPTEIIPDLTTLSELECEIYKIVTNRTLLMFAPNQKVSKTVVSVDIDGLEIDSTFSNIVENGYKDFELLKKEKKDQVFIPDYEVGKEVTLDLYIKESFTKKPSRVTESSLVDLYMEKYGLGTTATRSDIIENIIKNQYIAIDDKSRELTPTKKAYQLIDYINKNDIPYGDTNLTAQWEKDLSKIGKGQLKLNDFTSKVESQIITNINLILKK